MEFSCSSFDLTAGTFNAGPGDTTFRCRSFNHASGTFNPNNGTVILVGAAGGNFANTGGTQTFHNLTLNYTGTAHHFDNANIVVTGTLRMVSGFPDTGTLKPLGDVVIENTFGPGGDPLAGTPANITFAGDSNAGNVNQTFTNNGGVNLTGTWTVDKPSGRVTLLSDLTLDGSQALNITSGTLDQGSSFNLQTSNTLTVAANGVLRNFGTGDLTLGGDLTNDGLVNINGGGTGCSDPSADHLQIRSTSATQRVWSGNGAFSLVDADVDTQSVGATPGSLTAFGSSLLNNTTNWTLNAGCPVGITSQPGDQAVCPGGSASFSVAASGAGVSLQWRKNSTPLANGGNISGADTALLTINPVGAGDVAGYDVVATSTLGITATSATAGLTLKAAPALTSSPGDKTVCEGQSASFSASATGDGIGFQWRRNGSPLSNGGRISGANSPMLTINPTVAGDTDSYDVVVSGDCSPSANSSPASLTVNTAPAVSSNPGNTTACEGALASFATAASGSPTPTVQWQVSTDGGANFNDLAGATATTLAFTANASQDGNKYRAVFGNTCSNAMTTAATLTVNGFALSASGQTFDAAGGGSNVNVITGSTCSWTAVSNDSFIHITISGGGTGNDTVNFTVDPSSGARVGTMTIAGQTFTVNQSAPTAADGNITGQIVDGTGRAVEGAVVRMSGAQDRLTITDANGFYRFENVETGGFYTVTPSRANFNFSPFNRSFTHVGNQTEAVFTGNSLGDHVNPLDTPEYFVRQQYVDILGREPDEPGFKYWSDQINQCQSSVVSSQSECVSKRRREVAAAFFMSEEYQATGSYIYDVYVGALGRQPRYGEYTEDRQQVIGGATLDAAKTVFAQTFVQRAEFMTKYQNAMASRAFVEALLQSVQHTGADLSSERENLIAIYELNSDLSSSRAAVVRSLADNVEFKQSQYNRSFVLTEYFAHLRRDIDQGGYDFWLNVLNNAEPGNYSGMVCSFVTSTEYQNRFSVVTSHNNGECSGQ